MVLGVERVTLIQPTAMTGFFLSIHSHFYLPNDELILVLNYIDMG
jgi:hypothetical protein